MKNMNIQGLMKQAQKLQKDLEKEQSNLKSTEYVATDTNKLVKVTINGQKELIDLEIKEELVDPDDIEMLEDLIIATVNETMKMADTDAQSRMSKYTQGMNLPF